MGYEPIVLFDRLPLCRGQEAINAEHRNLLRADPWSQLHQPNRARALLDSGTSPRQSTWSVGHCQGDWPLQPRHSIEAVWTGQFPGTGHLRPSGIWWSYGGQGQTRWNHLRHNPGDWSMLRGDRSSHALSAKAGISRTAPGSSALPCGIRCSCRSRQSWFRTFSPDLFPTRRITNSSQFCCQQLCRASDTLAACRNTHRPIGIINGALRLSRKAWPVSKPTRPLVFGQRGSRHDASERTF